MVESFVVEMLVLTVEIWSVWATPKSLIARFKATSATSCKWSRQRKAFEVAKIFKTESTDGLSRHRYFVEAGPVIAIFYQ